MQNLVDICIYKSLNLNTLNEYIYISGEDMIN